MNDIDQKVVEYILNLNLSHYDWHPSTVQAESGQLHLGIVDRDGQLSLEVVMPWNYEDQDGYNQWMSADDLGWSGPVRYVVAWVKIRPE